MGNGDIGENVPALEFAGLVKRFGRNVAVDHIDQLAQQRLESHGPEVFARVRIPAS